MTGGRPRADCHVHTFRCNHAVGTMEECVEAAVSADLEEIGFLEHIEVGIDYPRRTWLTPELLDEYYEEGLALREKHERRIRVRLGVEVGFNPEAVEGTRDLIGRHPWDRVGLSYHFIHSDLIGRHVNLCSCRDPLNARGVEAIGLRETTRRYFQTLAEGIALLRPSMVCHVDVLERNYPSFQEDPEIWALIEKVLCETRQAGAALEINTGGYTYRGSFYPSPAILGRAFELGIPFVFSSDAHAPAEVGRCFDRAWEDCGRILCFRDDCQPGDHEGCER